MVNRQVVWMDRNGTYYMTEEAAHRAERRHEAERVSGLNHLSRLENLGPDAIAVVHAYVVELVELANQRAAQHG